MSATLAAVLATALRLVASHAYAEGAPPGFSGGFKEDSCHACHFHAEVNSGGGRVRIEGVPAQFVAGQRYTLTVTLTRAGMKRAGSSLPPDSRRVARRPAPGGPESRPYALTKDDQDRIWFSETGESKRLIGFDPKTEKFFANIEVSGTIRHMHFDRKTRMMWFGTDANTVGRIALHKAK